MDAMMTLRIELDREEDGRWIASVEAIGVFVYGDTREKAIRAAKSAAFTALSFLQEKEDGDVDQVAFTVEAA